MVAVIITVAVLICLCSRSRMRGHVLAYLAEVLPSVILTFCLAGERIIMFKRNSFLFDEPFIPLILFYVFFLALLISSTFHTTTMRTIIERRRIAVTLTTITATLS